MASNNKEKIKKITLDAQKGAFSTLFSRFRGSEKSVSSDISMLRSILTNEKARILHTLKTKQPNSIYELAKLLARDFKSVRQDILVLEKMGFLELIPIHKGKREKLKPLLVVDALEIRINL
jgi:predicted transcriptional regulator